MQWVQTTFLEDSLTLADMLRLGADLIGRGRYILLIGGRSRIKLSETQYVQSPTLEALLCSVEHLIKAHSALQSLTGTSAFVNGLTPLKNVSKVSDGFVECLLMSEAILTCSAILELAEGIVL